MTGTPGCCARAVNGQVVTAEPAMNLMNSRRFITSPEARRQHRGNWRRRSFEHLIGGDHEALRDRNAERLGGIQVDVDFEFR